MVLTQDQRTRLCERLDDLKDFGGLAHVAELAGLTARVIQKAQAGGNVQVETMELITDALTKAENEKKAKVKKVEKTLA